ncbi:MAG: hypothetical protein ACOC6B_07520 [Thermodesulfobacteriota bacterium]
MSINIQADQWVWVIVQDPEKDAQFLGQHDEHLDISYIPMFLEKEDALQCLNLLTRDKKKKYEAQAIQYDQLAHDAAENGFMLFVLNNAGEILDKITPEK